MRCRSAAAEGSKKLVSWRSWCGSLALVLIVCGSRLPCRSQRRRNMFVYRLAFVVVFGMQPAIRAGNSLRRLVRFEAQIPLLILVRLLEIAHPAVAKHHVVIRLQVFGIDGQGLAQLHHGLAVLVLQEENTAYFVTNDAVLGILRCCLLQMLQSAVIIAVGS